MERIRNYINGEWVDARAGRTASDRNPANVDEVLAEYPLSDAEDVRAAVAAARAALPAWRRTSAPRRGELLFAVRAAMHRRREELALALSREEGKTLADAGGEVQRSLNVLEFIAGEGRRLSGETTPSELPNTFCYTVREPLGVVAVVTPWNFPLAIPAWKIAPALLCGNTVVFKPASLTPWTAKLLVECFLEAGLPRGVLNLVYGGGATVGDVLVGHPDVQAVTFTGSNEVGNRLWAQATASQKKCQCEMGGKNPVLVLEDADLELAAAGIVQGAFGSTGQRCTATSRVVVLAEVAEALTARILEKTRELVVGEGTRPGVTMGPLVDEVQLRTVLDYVEVGRREGARLVLGGQRLTEGALAKGFFVEPTIFTGVRPTMRLAQEETFGPILAILTARDLDEAIEICNGVRFGLSSSIYGRDVNRIFSFLERIESGITHVNSPTVGGEAHLPFGGVKATGVGQRELGGSAIEFYSELKTVYVDYTGAIRTTKLY